MLDSYKQQNKKLKQLDLVSSQVLIKHAFIHCCVPGPLLALGIQK